MASNFYRARDAPRYVLGHALEIGFISVGIIAGLFLIVAYRKINSNRERKLASGAGGEFTPQELSALGDRAITFRYVL